MKIILKELKDYQKKGLWLAVVTKKQKMKVVAASPKPETALREAHEAGFLDAALIQSASNYAAWVM